MDAENQGVVMKSSQLCSFCGYARNIEVFPTLGLWRPQCQWAEKQSTLTKKSEYHRKSALKASELLFTEVLQWSCQQFHRAGLSSLSGCSLRARCQVGQGPSGKMACLGMAQQGDQPRNQTFLQQLVPIFGHQGQVQQAHWSTYKGSSPMPVMLKILKSIKMLYIYMYINIYCYILYYYILLFNIIYIYIIIYNHRNNCFPVATILASAAIKLPSFTCIDKYRILLSFTSIHCPSVSSTSLPSFCSTPLPLAKSELSSKDHKASGAPDSLTDTREASRDAKSASARVTCSRTQLGKGVFLFKRNANLVEIS